MPQVLQNIHEKVKKKQSLRNGIGDIKKETMKNFTLKRKKNQKPK